MNHPLDFDHFQSAYQLSREKLQGILNTFTRPNAAAHFLSVLARDPILQHRHPELLRALVERVLPVARKRAFATSGE